MISPTNHIFSVITIETISAERKLKLIAWRRRFAILRFTWECFKLCRVFQGFQVCKKNLSKLRLEFALPIWLFWRPTLFLRFVNNTAVNTSFIITLLCFDVIFRCLCLATVLFNYFSMWNFKLRFEITITRRLLIKNSNFTPRNFKSQHNHVDDFKLFYIFFSKSFENESYVVFETFFFCKWKLHRRRWWSGFIINW